MARLESGEPKDIGKAMQILKSIISLPRSELKAEAQFRIAEATLKRAVEAAKEEESGVPNLSGAMLAFKKCANNYPESSFAGQSLEKIANYYIQVQDYQRAMEMMDQVFQDYPDASFLDEMLLKWVIAAYRAGKFEIAGAKCEQLLSEYPDSKAAQKATKFQKTIRRKLGG